ncbi:dihydrofolate reductase family protein [Naasia sp. SYSU D00057]|uniref:dihydrofolate reductase family protein n=1 Tax=Naasia sp. SYSU D00057 TaxID=2817380 RepID=UPI001B30780C|nr:dihydrofolate reductase family protein [Naasia sp. SYSU D00057]
MRKIVSNFFISLDGVVEAPHEWHFPYFSDEMGAAVDAGMGSATAMLLGRKGYDEWAAFWPNQDADDPFAAQLNGVEKYVLTSRPLEEPVWTNSTAVTDDVAERIRALKEQGEGDIAMSGSATTVRWLLAEGLLDELNLLVHPLAVGRGQRLFEDGDSANLELESSETLPNGVLHLRYRPAAA